MRAISVISWLTGSHLIEVHVLHAHIFHHRCLLVNVGRDHSKCRAALFKHACAEGEMKNI